MRLAELLTLLRTGPLLMEPDYRAELLHILESHAAMPRDEFRLERTGKAKSGDALEIEQVEVRDGVTIIPVGGPIGANLGEFEKGAGAVDVNDLRDELAEAEENDDSEKTVFNFDSNGGGYGGLPELAADMLNAQKPVYAYCGPGAAMNSAALYLAVCCGDGVFCAESSIVGSVGVCGSYMDLSGMAAQKGITVKTFASGKYKGMGTLGTSLTAEQELFLQNKCLALAADFKAHVVRWRGEIAADDMEGQSFLGKLAADKNFVDGIFPDLSSFLRFIE